MQWTQKEVSKFGGDPDQVTIMGMSSGAVAVSLITMSPKTGGLFKQAVVQSGSATGSLTFSKDSISWNREFAISVGCASDFQSIPDEIDQIVECMRSLDSQRIVDAYVKFENNSPQLFGLAVLSKL